MRLTEIKLAGFKSFVDPTTVPLRGDLIAVVGPNGCGKSNVIDAVRWVLGESSARQLRGDTLTDVIFNGSSTRMPTAFGAVELIFDNRDARVGGAFAKYAEISVRREVSRGAQSTYYLNGAKCRRRDIADVFLGTGFGPRTYSIIEQGMISEIVSAKPEQLRGYLEEAAGISVYRERRRETGNSIRHAQENLQRLTDIRRELGAQVAKLDRQAKAAGRYRDLKEEERRLIAERLALGLRQLDEKLAAQDAALRQLSLACERAVAERQAVDVELDKENATKAEVNGATTVAQGQYYRHGAEVARLEQAIRFNEERVTQLETNERAAADDAQAAAQALAIDREKASELRAKQAALAPALERSRATDAEASAGLTALESDMLALDRAWDTFMERKSAATVAVEADRQRIARHEQALTDLNEQLAQLAAHLPHPDVDVNALRSALAAVRQAAEAADSGVAANAAAVRRQETVVADAERRVATLERELQGHESALAAISAVQAEALGKDGAGGSDSAASVAAYLAGQGLTEALRVGEKLEVEAGWELAVGMVLGHSVQGILVADDAVHAEHLEAMTAVRLTLVSEFVSERGWPPRLTAPALSMQGVPPRAPRLRALADFVTGSAGSLLAGVYAAEGVAEALAWRSALAAGESVVTRTGVWLGVDWVRIDGTDSADAGGVVRRARDIAAAQEARDRTSADLAVARRHHGETRRQLRPLAAAAEDLQRRQADARAKVVRAETELDAGQRRVAEAELARRRHANQKAALTQRAERVRVVLAEARERLVEGEAEQAMLDAEGRRLRTARAAKSAALEPARVAARTARDGLQRALLEAERVQTSLRATEDGHERLSRSLEGLDVRANEVRAALAEVRAKTPGIKQALAEELARRADVQDQLVTLRRQAEVVAATIRDLSARRRVRSEQLDQANADHQQARIDRERLDADQSNLRERFAETGLDFHDVLSGMPDDADDATWGQRLGDVQRRIDRLGTINMGAIEEYRTESERKADYDRQCADVEASLATLQSAIRKLDRDTRDQFKETFERVNGNLNAVFPRVFGGGHASLELTSDDWLDTGVTLMARPPGKRNASIQLLSGGEKAMTAVALLFAIFRLNASPVCLLDEVDAPLDDANVGRVAGLIKDMSTHVQFVIVTHNRQTIEVADHLLGVTMQEAGVSRLVAVDLERATQLVAAG